MTDSERLRKLEEAVKARRIGEPKTAAEMTDEELCESIGGPGTRPEDISDEDLQYALANPGECLTSGKAPAVPNRQRRNWHAWPPGDGPQADTVH